MIHISCVSYLNSAPFIHGLRKAAFNEAVKLVLDNPADCARKLLSGEATIGLVPVAVIPQIPNATVISGFCIGADGPVQSVTLLGDVPVEEMDEILLDYESRTSVALMRLLARDHWKVSPVFSNTEPGYESRIVGTTGGVVIGDRSLKLRNEFSRVYDLAEEWKKMTGLPFVFACWVSNRPLSAEFLIAFNKALESGLNDLDEVISSLPENGLTKEGIRDYLTHSISYRLDAEKKKGMDLFLDHLKALEELPIRLM